MYLGLVAPGANPSSSRPSSLPGTSHRHPKVGFLAERVMSAYVLGRYRETAFPGLLPEFRGVANIDPQAPARAGALRLARYCLQGRIAPGAAIRAWRGIG